MGCDYYISKYLLVEFQDLSSIFIELELERGYYTFSVDEDDPNYDKKYEEYVYETLNVDCKLIIIYNENHFRTNELKIKYKNLIDYELNLYNQNHEKKQHWDNIIKIVKKESRYERD